MPCAAVRVPPTTPSSTFQNAWLTSVGQIQSRNLIVCGKNSLRSCWEIGSLRPDTPLTEVAIGACGARMIDAYLGREMNSRKRVAYGTWEGAMPLYRAKPVSGPPPCKGTAVEKSWGNSKTPTLKAWTLASIHGSSHVP